MSLPSIRKRRRRAQTLTVLGLIIVTGLYFYIQRLQIIFQERTEIPRAVEWKRAALSIREPAQEIPESSRFMVVHRWVFENPDSLSGWEEKIFKPKTLFTLMPQEGGFLHSVSQNACSGMFVKTDEPATADLWIDWKWRALKFPTKKNPEILSNRAEDDFAARIYVIFLANNLFRSDVIEYVWDKTLPVGMYAESPFSDRIRLLVAQSGEVAEGPEGWRHEQRNVYADYRNLFGHDPRYPVGMVALMSDSDTTGTAASADFGEIILKRKKS